MDQFFVLADDRLVSSVETSEQAQIVAGRVNRILRKTAEVITRETAAARGLTDLHGRPIQ